MNYSLYYRAHVTSSQCWFLVGIIRSFEHLAFDRTFDVEQSVFEFFVPEENETYFLQLMDYFIEQGVVSDLRKLPNRLLDPTQDV